MKIFSLTIIFSFIASFICAQGSDQIPTLAITDVTVIDATGRDPQPSMTVLLSDDKICAIQPVGRVKIPSGTRIVSGKGKYLIPGLWDMHVHISNSQIFIPLLIANGVTSVRQMTSNEKGFRRLKEMKSQIAAKKMIGPDIYLPVVVFGKDQQWDGIIQMNTQEDVAEVIGSVKEKDADFIKVFDLYDPAIFKSLLKEAKKQHISVAGHCPLAFNMGEIAMEGMDSFEHFFGVPLACSSEEASIRQQLIQTAKEYNSSFDDIVRLLYWILTPEILNTYDPEKAQAFISILKKSDSYQCPTAILWDGWSKLNDTLATSDYRLKYIPDSYLKTWLYLKDNPMSKKLSGEDFIFARKIMEKYSEMLRLFCKAGIPMIAGTDVSLTNPYNFPGFGLHDELSLLVKAGLSSMQAIQAATKNAATVLGVLDKTGTVEQGKCADLVLLNANPLDDINNTRKINAVFRAGSYLSGTDLNDMLQKEEKMAQAVK
ncbi:MAG: amidohydrolase family protein [Porphyromonadaceae bacterium]|nr:amidohydrolase family protein [Porphyromonadaceae bacterium]